MAKHTKKRLTGRWLYNKTQGLHFEPDDPKSKSKTQQQFADECDVNSILARFTRTGLVPTNQAIPQYGDFTDVGDYQDSLTRVKEANDQFLKLDPKVREMFENDPANMIKFLEDDNNFQEAIDLGILPGQKSRGKKPQQKAPQQEKEPDAKPDGDKKETDS